MIGVFALFVGVSVFIVGVSAGDPWSAALGVAVAVGGIAFGAPGDTRGR